MAQARDTGPSPHRHDSATHGNHRIHRGHARHDDRSRAGKPRESCSRTAAGRDPGPGELTVPRVTPNLFGLLRLQHGRPRPMIGAHEPGRFNERTSSAHDHRRRNRLRGARHRRLPRGLRQHRDLRGLGCRQDRPPPGGRDSVLRAGPPGAGGPQRARGAAALLERPGTGAQAQQGRVHHRGHAAQGRRHRRHQRHLRRGQGDRQAPQRLHPGGPEEHGAGRHRARPAALPAQAGDAVGRVRRGLEPRIPARRLGDRDVHAPRPRRHRRRVEARREDPARHPQSPVPARNPHGGHEPRDRRAHQVRLQRVPRHQDLVHQRDRQPVRGAGRRRQGGGQGDGYGPPHRLQVPALGPGLRGVVPRASHAPLAFAPASSTPRSRPMRAR